LRFQYYQNSSGSINWYDIRQGDITDYGYDAIISFLNDPKVRNAIHVPVKQPFLINKAPAPRAFLYEDGMVSYTKWVDDALFAGLKVMLWQSQVGLYPF